MLNNLLIYRVVIFNACVIAGLIWAFAHGEIQPLFVHQIAYYMVAVFVFAMIGFARRVQKTSAALNQVKAGVWIDARKFGVKSAFVMSVSVWLVTLGLLGNLIGFADAVKGLDLSGGTDAALRAIGQMVDGMEVAFYTTMIGTGLGLWLGVNGFILRTATALLQIDAASIRPMMRHADQASQP